MAVDGCLGSLAEDAWAWWEDMADGSLFRFFSQLLLADGVPLVHELAQWHEVVLEAATDLMDPRTLFLMLGIEI